MTYFPIERAVPFNLFEGYPGFEPENQLYLRFMTADLVALKAWTKAATSYRRTLLEALLSGDEEAMIESLKVGLKKHDLVERQTLATATLRDLPFNLKEAGPLIIDALSLAWHGVPASKVEEAESVPLPEEKLEEGAAND
jgi:hypothetical protein